GKAVAGLGASGFGPRASGFGLGAAGFGRRASGLGPRASDFEPLASGLGPRASDFEPLASGLGQRTGVGPRASGLGQRKGLGPRASGLGQNGDRVKLAENPFFVLGISPDASRIEVEREAQKLLGMLELGFAAAHTYATPLGPRPRTAEAVRAAVAALRDPYQRLVA